MIYKFLLFATIFIPLFTNICGNLCHNCITREYQNIYDDYINTPGNEKMMFPSGKSDCNNSRKITCRGECVGIKIEEFKKKDNGNFVGYVYGCAEQFFKRKILSQYPVQEAQKFCDKPNHFDISYSLSIKTTYCRCKEEMCNNPGKDFVNADYVPPPSSQISSSLSRSAAQHPPTSTTKTAATLASIGTNALAISSHGQIYPIKLIFSNLLVFIIYQMF
uniref:Uncharacterized protein n=1 Tax=Panagrolaimus sp. PS1159 TaxID=55785 RepID=A0AC35F4J2_9BILA